MSSYKRPLTTARSVKEKTKAFDNWRGNDSGFQQQIWKTKSYVTLPHTGHNPNHQSIDSKQSKYKSENNIRQSYVAQGNIHPREAGPRPNIHDDTHSAKAKFNDNINELKNVTKTNVVESYNDVTIAGIPSIKAKTIKGNDDGYIDKTPNYLFGSNKNIEYLARNEFTVSNQRLENTDNVSDSSAKSTHDDHNHQTENANVYAFRQSRVPSSESGKEQSLRTRSRTSLHSSKSSNLNEMGKSHSRYRKISKSRNSDLSGSKEQVNKATGDINENINNGFVSKCQQARERQSNSSYGETVSNLSLPKSDITEKKNAITRYVNEVTQPIGSNNKYMTSSVSEPILYRKEAMLQSRKFVQTMGEGVDDDLPSVHLEQCSNFSLRFGASQGDLNRSHLQSASQPSFKSDDLSVIRHNILDATNERLAEHQRNHDIDTEFRRYKKAKLILDKEGLLVLTCNHGDGSTYLGYDLMASYKDHDKYILSGSSEWKSCIHAGEKSIVMADDAFGKLHIDTKEVDNWSKIIERNQGNLVKKRVKIILIVKHSVTRHCGDFLTKRYTLNLSDSHCQLIESERLQILRQIVLYGNHGHKIKICEVKEDETISQIGSKAGKFIYISNESLKQIAREALSTGFPLQAQEFLSSKDNISQCLEFFTKSSKREFLEINSWKTSELPEDLDKYLALTATLVYDGKLKMKNLDALGVHGKSDQKGLKPYLKELASCSNQSRIFGKMSVTPISENLPDWQHFLPEMASLFKYNTNDMRRRIERGANLLNGTYLEEVTPGTWGFPAPCIKNAMLLSLAELFTQEIIKSCESDFFFSYVGTNEAFEIGESRCIRLDVSAKNNTCINTAINRLKSIVLDGNVEEFTAHPLMRDETFVDLFFKAIKKERSVTGHIISMVDKTTKRSLISHGLDNTFFVGSTAYNLAVKILLNKKWLKKRKAEKAWALEQERQVIEHCCKHRSLQSAYFNLIEMLNIPINRQCLFNSIESGSVEVVKDIISIKPSSLQKEDLCRGMHIAFISYEKTYLESGSKIIKALSEYVPIDYKINGLESTVHVAGKTGNCRLLVALKKFDADFNLVDENRHTCVHLATINNHSDFIAIALNKFGAVQNKFDNKGFLPIHIAADLDRLKVTKKLYENDSDIISAKDKTGREPLHIAARKNNQDVARFLLSKNVNVDSNDENHQTPLHHAALSKKSEVVHFLLESNADVNAIDIDTNTPLLMMCKSSNEKGLKRLLKEKQKLSNMEMQCMFIAVENGKIEIVNILVDNGMHVNGRNSDDKTLLHFAIERNAQMVGRLIELGANVSDPTKNLFPIHLATRRGEIDTLNTLFEAGARSDQVTPDTCDTILHIATLRCKHYVAEHILKHSYGENLIDCRNKKGMTALHIAAKNCDYNISKLLLDFGASRSMITNKAQTALQLLEVELEAAKGRFNMKKLEEYKKIRSLLLSRTSYRSDKFLVSSSLLKESAI